MKGRMLVIISSLLVVGAMLPGIATAQEPGKEFKSLATPLSDPPMPLGAEVEFILDDELGELIIKWCRPLGNNEIGVSCLTYFSFVKDSVNVTFSDFQQGDEWLPNLRPPGVGDIGVVDRYSDLNEDGRIDHVSVSQQVDWDEREEALIHLGYKFEEYAKKEGFFLVSHLFGRAGAEAQISHWVDGKPAEVVLAGGIEAMGVRVPPEGAWFVMWEQFPNGRVLGQWWFVRPGDWLMTDQVRPISAEASRPPHGPDFVCGVLQRLRPQWQPGRFPSDSDIDCPGLYLASDQSLQAELARRGFLQANLSLFDMQPSPWVDMPQDFVPFVFIGPDSEAVNQWLSGFVGKWHSHSREGLTLPDGTTYALHINDERPVAELIGGKEKGLSDFYYLNWGDPIIFVPRHWMENYHGFSLRVPVFRLIRSGWNEITVHQLVW